MATIDRHLAVVPPATYTVAHVKAGQKWSAEFNVACWLRCRLVTGDTSLTLVLRYRDALGEQQVTVDQAACSRDCSVLLSAVATVPATGRIEEMSVSVLLSGRCELAVDELFVQRRGEAAAAARIIAS